MIALGTVMEIEKNRALVFTMDGGVVYIKPRLGLFVGQQVSFTRNELLAGRRRLMTVLPIAAAAAALLIVAAVAAGFLGLGGLPPAPAKPCAAYIALDINPSIQFKIDENGVVLGAAALNEDGRKLLESLNLTGMKVDAAVREAIARAKALGYIKDNSSVVLVAGTLNDDNSSVSGSRSEYRRKLESILGGLNGGGGADVLALYVDDSTVKTNADKNGISLGRELLREFAEKNNVALADEEIRSGRITDLLDKIGSDVQKCAVNPEETATPEPTEEPTVEPADEPAEESTALTEKTEPADTAEPTPSPTAYPPVAGVEAAAVEGGIKVSWPKATTGNGKFLYYKIVFSSGDATPVYPEDGYAKVINDKFTLNTVVKSNSAYNGGDLGGKVKAGETYYVSVTYVYENEIRPANAVRVKCPEPVVAPPASADYSVSASVSGDHIHIKWDKAPTAEGFVYYKVVLSKGDSSPKYPDNGYLYCFSNIDETSCDAHPGDCYNGGDGGVLMAGQAYYISVTYVYDGDVKHYGTTKRVTMPGSSEPEAPPVEFASPSANASIEGDIVHISWNKLPAGDVTCGGVVHKGFGGYKIVASTSPNPKYPDDGYLRFIGSGGINTCSWSFNYKEAGTYNHMPELASGTWYISVTYLFNDGGYIYANDDTLVIP